MAEYVLSRNTAILLVSRHFEFKDAIQFDEVTSSKKSALGTSMAKFSGSSTITSQALATGSQGKTATQIGHSLTPGLLVAASSIAKLTTMSQKTPRSFPPADTAQTSARTAMPCSSTPSHKATIGASNVSWTTEAMAGGAGSAAVWPTVQHQRAHGVSLPFANLVPFKQIRYGLNDPA